MYDKQGFHEHEWIGCAERRLLSNTESGWLLCVLCQRAVQEGMGSLTLDYKSFAVR